MNTLPQRDWLLDLGDCRLECRWIGPAAEDALTLVLLHEGLGCIGLWGDFPQRLAAQTGAGVFLYSRQGYGGSSSISLPRPLTYMQDEARLLPDVLEAVGFKEGLLAGHSDGASIAAIFASDPQNARRGFRINGVSLLAPHVFVEDLSIRSIMAAKEAYEQGDLKQRLARWHSDVDAAFYGWNGAWLHPDFRHWDITGGLSDVFAPVQIIQGADDRYGTLAQVRAIEKGVRQKTQCHILDGVGHSPHKEAPLETLALLTDFFHKTRASKNMQNNAFFE